MTKKTKNLIIREVKAESLIDLCRICVPVEQHYDPTHIYGMVMKKTWAQEMLHRWGRLAKIAYIGSSPVGFIQYEPVPEEKIVLIHCIYIPQEQHLHKGIAKSLLLDLINDMRNPLDWFDHKPARFLVTRTFPGQPGTHYSARDFFKRMGFKQITDDPEELYYPLNENDTYAGIKTQELTHLPQAGDHGVASIINEPSFCPYTYIFLKKAEDEIRNIAPDIPIKWINRFDHLQSVSERGDTSAIIVNGSQIMAPVYNLTAFRKEVQQALARELPE